MVFLSRVLVMWMEILDLGYQELLAPLVQKGGQDYQVHQVQEVHKDKKENGVFREKGY